MILTIYPFLQVLFAQITVSFSKERERKPSEKNNFKTQQKQQWMNYGEGNFKKHFQKQESA